jgi:hypothetical protein
MLEDLDDAGERRRLDALRATVHETSRSVIYNSAA